MQHFWTNLFFENLQLANQFWKAKAACKKYDKKCTRLAVFNNLLLIPRDHSYGGSGIGWGYQRSVAARAI